MPRDEYIYIDIDIDIYVCIYAYVYIHSTIPIMGVVISSFHTFFGVRCFGFERVVGMLILIITASG